MASSPVGELSRIAEEHHTAAAFSYLEKQTEVCIRRCPVQLGSVVGTEVACSLCDGAARAEGCWETTGLITLEFTVHISYLDDSHRFVLAGEWYYSSLTRLSRGNCIIAARDTQLSLLIRADVLIVYALYCIVYSCEIGS